MKKSINLQLVFTWIFALLPLLLGVLLYNRLPAEIPTHWGLNGSVTYSAKSAYWGLACISPGVVLLLRFSPRVDPRRKNYEKFRSYYDLFGLFLSLFFLVIISITISESFYPGKISVGPVVVMLVGLLFVVLGNLMPKIKSNFFIGMKTPWTISDPDVWNRVQRLGGQMMFFMGLLMILTAFFLPEKILFILVVASALAFLVVPTVASYLWYHRLHPTGSEEE